MFRQILTTCLGRRMKLYTRKWNKYSIKLFHDRDDLRSFPGMGWIPYFWDSDITFEIGILIPDNLKNVKDVWRYHWELRDLDGNIISKGNENKQGNGEIEVTNSGFRKKLALWNSGKRRAMALGNLHPHKEYMLYVNFTSGDYTKSETYLMASFEIEDRGSYQMQIFLILFTIFMTLFFSILARGCGITT
ncbi:MAG: hypothetical protein PHQ86_01805 [Dehalococcoidales bacterium]|nr:hypothetical protein [Dehalococcoidales bacterium]